MSDDLAKDAKELAFAWESVGMPMDEIAEMYLALKARVNDSKEREQAIREAAEISNASYKSSADKAKPKVKSLESELRKWTRKHDDETLQAAREQSKQASFAAKQAYINGLYHQNRHLEDRVKELEVKKCPMVICFIRDEEIAYQQTMKEKGEVMKIIEPGLYRLTTDWSTRGVRSIGHLKKGQVIRIAQIDKRNRKVIGPSLLDWTYWEMPVEKLDNN